MRIFEFLLVTKAKQASVPEPMDASVEESEAKERERELGVTKFDDIIRPERIGHRKVDNDSRYCYDCGATISRNTGYLVQAAIPPYATNVAVAGVPSLIGISCEHRDGDLVIALWYWLCDKCGSKEIDENYQSKYADAARHFWRTGQPPKRRPVWQEEV